MLTHPPWSPLDRVRQRLCKLGRRVTGQLVHLLSDSLGEAVRSAVDAFLHGRRDAPSDEPIREPQVEDSLSQAKSKPTREPGPLWQRIGQAVVRALIPTALLVTTALLSC